MVADLAQTATGSAAPAATTKRLPYESWATAGLYVLAMLLALGRHVEGTGSVERLGRLSLGRREHRGIARRDDIGRQAAHHASRPACP